MNATAAATAASPMPAVRVAAVDHAALTEFDLHGMVGIRLIDATPRDRATVARQLGPIAARLRRDPDIVIRFVDRLATASPLHLIGVDAAFADDAFMILRSKHKSPARVQIAFDAIGTQCEIVAEHGIPAIPLLIAIINLTVLARGGLALHASAFRYQGTSTLVMGWAKGGKTETLLAFIQQGAEYIGDEWIYISADGSRMFGIPEPIRVWHWLLSQLPQYRSHVGARTRIRLAALRQAHGFISSLAEGSPARMMMTLQKLRSVADLIDRQRYAFLRPESAFGRNLGSLSGSIDRVIFASSTDDGVTRVATTSGAWIADRMAFSLREERSALDSYYRRFRFAFPDRANPLIDGATALERRRLRQMLENRPCHALYHPYPPSIAELFRAVAPLFPH
jgi:hypothetical protein